jgi:hypothetical protein
MTSVFGVSPVARFFSFTLKISKNDSCFKELFAVLSNGRAAVALEFPIVKRVRI